MRRRADPLQRYVERSAALEDRWRAIRRLEGEAYISAVRGFAVEKARLRRDWGAFRPFAEHVPSAAQENVEH